MIKLNNARHSILIYLLDIIQYKFTFIVFILTQFKGCSIYLDLLCKIDDDEGELIY